MASDANWTKPRKRAEGKPGRTQSHAIPAERQMMSSSVGAQFAVITLAAMNQARCAMLAAMAPRKYSGRIAVFEKRAIKAILAMSGSQMEAPQYLLKTKPPAAPAIPASEARG